jgi:arsenate reductase
MLMRGFIVPALSALLLAMADSATESTSYNVLFICTENSARSILAEAAMNSISDGSFRAYSAGSRPSGTVHPMTIAVLEDLHIDPSFARSKSWDEFSSPDSPQMHFVFTVCDAAAGEKALGI